MMGELEELGALLISLVGVAAGVNEDVASSKAGVATSSGEVSAAVVVASVFAAARAVLPLRTAEQKIQIQV